MTEEKLIPTPVVCDDHLSVSLPAALKKQLRDFADKEGVTASTAARFIIARFLGGNFNENQGKPITKAGKAKASA